MSINRPLTNITLACAEPSLDYFQHLKLHAHVSVVFVLSPSPQCQNIGVFFFFWGGGRAYIYVCVCVSVYMFTIVHMDYVCCMHLECKIYVLIICLLSQFEYIYI